MAHSRRQFVYATAAGTFVTALAGCSDAGGEATGTGDPTDTGTPTDTATATATGTGTDTDTDTGTGADAVPTVAVRSLDALGDVLVDAEGLTLYMFDSDERGSGSSSCTGGCLDNWPPLTVDGEATAGADVTASLSTFERDDGAVQVAANGWPLYYYAGDGGPGDANGQAVGDVWWVVRPDGTPFRGGTGTDSGSYYSPPARPRSRDGRVRRPRRVRLRLRRVRRGTPRWPRTPR